MSHVLSIPRNEKHPEHASARCRLSVDGLSRSAFFRCKNGSDKPHSFTLDLFFSTDDEMFRMHIQLCQHVKVKLYGAFIALRVAFTVCFFFSRLHTTVQSERGGDEPIKQGKNEPKRKLAGFPPRKRSGGVIYCRLCGVVFPLLDNA